MLTSTFFCCPGLTLERNWGVLHKCCISWLVDTLGFSKPVKLLLGPWLPTNKMSQTQLINPMRNLQHQLQSFGRKSKKSIFIPKEECQKFIKITPSQEELRFKISLNIFLMRHSTLVMRIILDIAKHASQNEDNRRKVRNFK